MSLSRAEEIHRRNAARGRKAQTGLRARVVDHDFFSTPISETDCRR